MKTHFISISEAAADIGVARGTLDYYLRKLKDPEIERVRFPLDKRVYIRLSDVERIKRLREEAAERGQQTMKMPAVRRKAKEAA